MQTRASERCETRLQKRPCEIWTRSNGAAQESNLPSRGLRDLTGFEDRSILSPGVPLCPRSPSCTGSAVQGVRLSPPSTPVSGLSW